MEPSTPTPGAPTPEPNPTPAPAPTPAPQTGAPTSAPSEPATPISAEPVSTPMVEPTTPTPLAPAQPVVSTQPVTSTPSVAPVAPISVTPTPEPIAPPAPQVETQATDLSAEASVITPIAAGIPEETPDILAIAATEPAVKMPKGTFAEMEPQKKSSKLPLILAIVIGVIIIVGVLVFFLFFNKPAASAVTPEQTAPTQPEEPKKTTSALVFEEWGVSLKYPSNIGVLTSSNVNSYIFNLATENQENIGIMFSKMPETAGAAPDNTFMSFSVNGVNYILALTAVDDLIAGGAVTADQAEEIKSIQDSLVEYYKTTANALTAL